MALRITTWRIIISAWKHLIRNAWIGLATVVVLVLSLLSVNVVVGVGALVQQAVHVLEDRVDVSVFFKDKTPDAVVKQAMFFMASLPQVQNATILTPDEALVNFKKIHADDPKLLEALNELDQNPLGSTLVIKAKQAEDYPFLLSALQNPQFGFAIDSKNYDDHAEAIRKVRSIGESVRIFGIVLVAIFGFFSVLIVYNSIRVAIYTQRAEIKIMRLVGASGSFVRLPFVLEGLFLAIIASLITCAIVAGSIAFLDPRLRSIFGGADPGLQSFFVNNVWLLITYEGGALLALVALSSWAAVGKYLRQ